MTVRLVDIIAGLKNQLAAIDGLSVTDYVPGDARFPAAFIVPPDIDYRQTFIKGYIRLELEVVVLVSANVDRMQKDLFDYLDWSGSKSIVTVVDADKTLGLTGIEAVVVSARPLGVDEIASYQAYGAAIRFFIGSTTS